MQVSLETTSGLERRLTVGIPADVVDAEVEKRLKQAAKTVNINGFRKGKVPIKVVKQRYGAGVRQEVLGDTIQKTFYEAVQKEDVRPAGQPSIEPKQMDEGKDVEYIATFEVYPEVEVQGTEGMEITRYSADIKDEDVEKMIDVLRKSQATWSEADKAAENDDRVVIDFAGTKDGEAFDGGSAEKQNLVLGSNSMIPGFEDGIVGMKAGEEKDINVTFPEDYQAEELKGADAVFKITVHKVEVQELPELNESFFEKFGVADGGEEKFRADVLENMDREKNKAAKGKLKDQVMSALLEKNPVELPKALVDAEINALRQQALQQYGQLPEGLDTSTLLPADMFRAQAEKRTALGLLIGDLVAKQSLKADGDKVRALVDEAAASYEDPEEVVNYYYSNQQLLASVEAAALEDQVVDMLLDKANVTDVTISYEEIVKPADKQ